MMKSLKIARTVRDQLPVDIDAVGCNFLQVKKIKSNQIKLKNYEN